MIDLSQHYQRNESFVFRRIEDETILVPIKDNVGDMGSIYKLNEMGAFVWEQLDGERNLEVLKDKIINEYDVAPRQAEADLSAFVTQLKEIEAVVRVYWIEWWKKKRKNILSLKLPKLSWTPKQQFWRFVKPRDLAVLPVEIVVRLYFNPVRIRDHKIISSLVADSSQN